MFRKKQGDKEISSETDNLIICEDGIFAIEVKNIGSKGMLKLVIEQDGRWLKYNGSKEPEVMKNITEQTYRHVAFNEEIINTTLKEFGYTGAFIRVHPLIVLANENVSIENYSSVPIVRPSNIYSEICNNKEKIQPEIIPVINKIIEIYSSKSNCFDMLDTYNQLLEADEVFKESLDAYYSAIMLHSKF